MHEYQADTRKSNKSICQFWFEAFWISLSIAFHLQSRGTEPKQEQQLTFCFVCTRKASAKRKREKNPPKISLYLCTFLAIVSSTLALKSYPQAQHDHVQPMRDARSCTIIQYTPFSGQTPVYSLYTHISHCVCVCGYFSFYLCLLFLQLIYILSPFVWILLWLFFILLHRLLD